MKKLGLVLAGLFVLVSTASAQFFNESDVELYKKNIAEEARNLVKEHLDLTPEQADKFWPLYDEYDKEYDKLMDENLKLVEEYLVNYYDLSEEKAKDLNNKALDIQSKRVELTRKHLNKMYEVLPANVVGKFYQIDNRISLMEQVQRTSRVPLVRKQEKN